MAIYDHQIKLPFEKLVPALKNFPEDAMNPDVLLPMAFSIKVRDHPPLGSCSQVPTHEFLFWKSMIFLLGGEFITGPASMSFR